MAKTNPEEFDDFEDALPEGDLTPEEIDVRAPNSMDAAIERIEDLITEPVDVDAPEEAAVKPPEIPVPEIPEQVQEPDGPTEEVKNIAMEDALKSIHRLTPQAERQPRHRQKKADQKDANKAHQEFLDQPEKQPAAEEPVDLEPKPTEGFQSYVDRMMGLLKRFEKEDPRGPMVAAVRGVLGMIPGLRMDGDDAGIPGGRDVEEVRRDQQAAMTDAHKEFKESDLAWKRLITEMMLDHARQIDELTKRLERERTL